MTRLPRRQSDAQEIIIMVAVAITVSPRLFLSVRPSIQVAASLPKSAICTSRCWSESTPTSMRLDNMEERFSTRSLTAEKTLWTKPSRSTRSRQGVQRE